MLVSMHYIRVQRMRETFVGLVVVVVVVVVFFSDFYVSRDN